MNIYECVFTNKIFSFRFESHKIVYYETFKEIKL